VTLEHVKEQGAALIAVGRPLLALAREAVHHQAATLGDDAEKRREQSSGD